MTATLTTAEVADAIGTTPRELRKFLRAEVGKVGKGSRYALPGSKREITALAKKYAKWDEARNANKSDDEVETPEGDDEA